MSLSQLAARAARRVRTLPERHGGPLVLAGLCLILAVGLGLRVEFAKNHIDRPTPDSLGYVRIAESLYDKGEFGRRGDFGGEEVQEPTNYSPGLPLFAAGVYYLTGGVKPLLVRLLIALAGTVAILFTYLIGRRLAGPRGGLIATAPVAIYPALLEYSGMYMTECVGVFTVSATVLAFLWASDRPGGKPRRLRVWALPGFLMGITALVRPEYLVFGAAFAVLACYRAWRDAGSPRAGLTAGGLAAVSFVLVIVPWTVHNYISLHRFVPLSTGGGKALFIGTYLPARGVNDQTKFELLGRNTDLRRQLYSAYPRYKPAQMNPLMYTSQRRLPEEGVSPEILFSQKVITGDYIYLDQILKTLAARRYPGIPTDDALAKMGKDNISNYAVHQPLQYLDMLAFKAWRMWRNGPRNTMQQKGWLVFHGTLVGLCLAGFLILAWRRRWEAAVLGTLLLGVTAIGAILLPSERRILVLLPLVAALAGSGAVWIAAWLRGRIGAWRQSPRLPANPSGAAAGGS